MKTRYQSETPAYQRLYQKIRNEIVDGIYPYGSRLPSKRTVAADEGVSIVTVEHAYALLCDEGYAESRERSGFFVSFRPTDGFAGIGENPVPVPSESGQDQYHGQASFPFSVLAKTMRRVLADYGERLLERSPNQGMPVLRQALSRYLARSRGIAADPDQIVIGSGSEYLYRLVIYLLGGELRYSYETPSYKQIEQVYRASGVRVEPLPLGKDGIGSAALQASTSDVLHVSPYRSFPTGVTATASKRHEYVRWASRGRRFLIEDDFESEFSVSRKPEETLFALSDADNVLYLNTFSQTISPSIRMGYLVLPKQLLERFRKRVGFYSCTVPTFEQILVATLIDRGDFERHINRVRRERRAKSEG